MKPLKIAFVVGAFPTVSETFIVNQITSLIDKGHSVKIYSYQKGNTQKIHNSISAYHLLDNVIYKEKPSFNKFKRAFNFLKLILKYLFQINWSLLFKSLNFNKYGKKAINLDVFYERKFFILNKKFDVFHVHFATNAVDIATYKAEGFLRESKLVVTFHGYDINPSKIEFYKAYYKTIFEQVDYFTVNTIYIKEILLQVYPKLSNVFILPVGLDTNLFQKKDKNEQPEKPFKIVYCGRLIKLKGADVAVSILAELFKRGYKSIILEIIGEGELRTEIEKKIEIQSLDNFICLKGRQTQEEIINSFENAGLFLLPGIKDPFDGRCEAQGLVIQEAQAMELPVVVSDVGGMKYGVVPNETGFVVKENDIIGFADKIEFLINNPLFVESMGKKGREFVKKNYDSKILVKQLLDIYSY